jgi:FtsP/CotA-like multicopper oxidase with cupredoxin domain
MNIAMKKTTLLSRRDFLKLMGVGVGTAALSACGVTLPDLSNPAADVTFSTPGITPSPTSPALIVDLTAARTTVPILSGAETPVWRYQASVRDGAAESLQVLDGSYLGPIFRVKRGQRIQVKLKNELPDPTIIHWHGLRIPEEMDGHPRYAIAPGKTFDYDFSVLNRAGMYWFHPHPHQLTGQQAYFGLAGLFIVSDDEENALGLPSGEYDLPLVIQDRMFDATNRMVYMLNGMMDQMTGFLGDTILVNGKPDTILDVKASAYRLRLLNGSNSRIYKLAWQDGTPLTVIATDGGLLEAPITRDYVMLAPGERIELWVDFSAHQDAKLVSLAFESGSAGGMMGGGMMGGGSTLPNGVPLDILRVRVGEKGEPVSPLPQRLSSIARHRMEDAVNGKNPRSFVLAMQGMIHTINGRVFEMDAVANDEIVRLADLEVWEFVNLEGGGGGGMGMMNMEMPHPMHMHGVQFQVVERQIDRNFRAQYEQVSAGFVDEGWKDTVLVMPGESVKVLVRFEDFAGTYLYHCHNLEHEDAGMMRNYRVIS